ncbi:MAG: hypothetical protein ABI681_02425 [Gemmatimonadales bacterium]
MSALDDLSRRLFHGRNPGPLLGPWIACTIIAGGIYIFERKMPAFHEVVKPLYFIVVVILVIATGRWLRERQGIRRGGDRRHGDRRGGKGDKR